MTEVYANSFIQHAKKHIQEYKEKEKEHLKKFLNNDVPKGTEIRIPRYKTQEVFENGEKVKEVGSIITDPRRIVELAQMKKCLYNTQTKRHIPAAFVQNYQLVRVVMMINAGYLYEYKKK